MPFPLNYLALISIYLTSLLLPVQAFANDVQELRYTVKVKPKAGTEIESRLRLWICEKPEYYLEHQLNDMEKRCVYFNGATIYIGIKGNDGRMSNLKFFKVTGLDKSIDSDALALFFGTEILPCVVDPVSTSKFYKHCKTIEKYAMTGGKSDVDAKFRVYKSATLTFSFHLNNTLLHKSSYDNNGKAVEISEYEVIADKAGQSSDSIKQLAKDTFGGKFELDNFYEDRTKDLITFATYLQKRK